MHRSLRGTCALVYTCTQTTLIEISLPLIGFRSPEYTEEECTKIREYKVHLAPSVRNICRRKTCVNTDKWPSFWTPQGRKRKEERESGLAWFDSENYKARIWIVKRKIKISDTNLVYYPNLFWTPLRLFTELMLFKFITDLHTSLYMGAKYQTRVRNGMNRCMYRRWEKSYEKPPGWVEIRCENRGVGTPNARIRE